jgi:hypothetical protein
MASRPYASPALLLLTSARVPPELLEAAIARAHQEHERLHIVIPAVLPPTLPISAMPPHLAARVNALRRTAAETLARLRAPGRVEIVRGRDARSVLLAASVEPPCEVVLVGSAGWSLRRAARGVAPVTVLSDRGRRHHGRSGSTTVPASGPVSPGVHSAGM